ncbi:MAG: hypothetical protein WC615_21865 [Mucilaginibacter sp.]|jgi:hypothetical protein|uniref:hypothetical protein n=1 Tax=Mucilaginibacter sp. TaxID=1882438 RepID=UPI003563D787
MMKKLVLILFVFGSASAFGQAEKKISDTIFMIHDAPIISSKSRPLYIIDERLSKVQPQFKPADICDVKVLKPFDAFKLYGKDANDGAIILITKKFAIKRYQEKFSGLSIEYKSCLNSQKNNDDNFLYVVNGAPIQGESKIKELYNLEVEKIKELKFLKGEPSINGVIQLIIIVTNN